MMMARSSARVATSSGLADGPARAGNKAAEQAQNKASAEVRSEILGSAGRISYE
jgi:hypothetical protein